VNHESGTLLSSPGQEATQKKEKKEMKEYENKVLSRPPFLFSGLKARAVNN
jgi:hypothetical protein